MGTRVVSFEDTHPDTDEGHLLSVQTVKDVVAQMKDLAAAQRAGLVDKGAGSAEKARLRREILAGPVAHLAEVGKRASRSGFELGRTYRYKPGAQTYTAFLTAARAMQAKAQADAKLLVKFGLSEAVLAQLGELLDVRGGDRPRQRRPHEAQGCHPAARAVGDGARLARADDGRAEPAAVPGEPAAAGVLDQRQHGAGSEAGGGAAGGRAGGGGGGGCSGG